MTIFEKFFTSFLIILILLAGIFLWLYFTKWQQPLGPSLQLATPFGMPPTWTPNPDKIIAPQSTPDPAFAIQALPTLEPVTQTVGVCGGTTPMYILVIGSDSRGDEYLYGLADVIRLVRVDFATPKVTVLEFPRDLWVEIPDISDNLNGQDHEKLNQAYLYGNRGFGYTDDPAEGPGLLARTLTLNFGTQINHYAAVNMRTFVKIVDAVGGIDVTLPKTLDGRTADDTSERLLFLKGINHLNGTQAVTLARIRINGTFSRAENQNRVLCAMRAKLVSADVIPNIPNLIRSFKGAVQTSLSPEQLGQLACVGTQLQPQNIVFGSFPQQLFEQGRTYDPVFKKSIFTWKVDYDILREYIQRFNEGNWPVATVAQESLQEGDPVICQ